MRDVTIIGGGLTGLAAAYELEQLNVPYTLIEVKNRLGGSITSEHRDGFVTDSRFMVLASEDDWSFLPELGLEDALVPSSGNPKNVVFKDGIQSLVDALAKRITHPVMYRMAVSSLGVVDNYYGVCLENGLMLDSRALIVTAPARYASHMLYDLNPDTAPLLMNYHYDTIVRVSLGYRRDEITLPLIMPPDMAFAYWSYTDNPQRVPPDHLLIQLGLRLKLDLNAIANWLRTILQELRLPMNPVMTAAYFWPEADPISYRNADHTQRIIQLEALLPKSVALVGSDYRAHTLPERVHQGREAARNIAAWLKTRA